MKTQLIKPIQFKDLEFPHRVFYSPLAGCSDYPFRQMTTLKRPDRPALVYCEMVKMDALVRHDHNTYRILDYDTSMHPIAAQICGSKPEIAAQSAKIIEELGFDSIDLNCGCPVDKVTKDGSGSGLLKNPNIIGEILSNMIAAVSIPVTVKVRAGWDEEHINAPEVTKIAEEAGACAIYVHGRTRKQGYKGPARWEWIKACVDVAKTIHVIGNGDIIDGPSAVQMVEETGCAGVLVSRGTMGNPAIVQEILNYCRQGSYSRKTAEEVREELLEHYLKVLAYQQGRRSVVDARKIGCWYIKNSSHTRAFRDKISKIDSQEEALELMRTFSFR